MLLDQPHGPSPCPSTSLTGWDGRRLLILAALSLNGIVAIPSRLGWGQFRSLRRAARMRPSPEDMFVSAVRSAGDLAGVFEHDGETGYFYRYDQSRADSPQVLGAIHLISGAPDFSQSDVDVRWNEAEEIVGLFIRHQLWAAFSGSESYGGDYRVDGRPDVPDSVVASFR